MGSPQIGQVEAIKAWALVRRSGIRGVTRASDLGFRVWGLGIRV